MPVFRLSPRRLLLIAAGACLVTGGFLGYYLYRSVPPFRGVVSKVWLPPSDAAKLRGDILALHTHAEAETHGRFGKWMHIKTGVRYNTPSMVQADAKGKGLDPARCPNVLGVEEVVPSGCKKVGEVRGESVYAITRQLPSETTEAHVRLGGTYVVAFTGASDDSIAAYIRTLQGLSPRTASDVLNRNSVRVAAEKSDIKKRKDAVRHTESQAYRHLPFTPALPATLPAGWKQTAAIIMGETPEKPEHIEISYAKNKKTYVTVYLLPRGDFASPNRCGPLLYGELTYVPCWPIPGEDYFKGEVYGDSYSTRYLFRPIGNVLAVTDITVNSDAPDRVYAPDEADAQVAITKSLSASEASGVRTFKFGSTSYDYLKDDYYFFQLVD